TRSKRVSNSFAGRCNGRPSENKTFSVGASKNFPNSYTNRLFSTVSIESTKSQESTKKTARLWLVIRGNMPINTEAFVVNTTILTQLFCLNKRFFGMKRRAEIKFETE